MKQFFTLLAFLAGILQAQTVLQAGRVQWGDTLRWGDSDDSSSYIRIRGTARARDSAGTWVATDSCSLPFRLSYGVQMPNSKLELSYEVRTSSGNTDSSQVKWRVDSRYCRSASCDTWVPAGRFMGDTASNIIDSIVSVATTAGVTWKPTRQIFDVPGGTQIRFCLDNYRAGGQAGDTTYFRRHVIRTSSIPAGGTPPGGAGAAGGATAANQTSGSQKTQIVDGSGNVIASTSNNLNVQCANCSGSGASAADEASFTAGSSTFAPAGGFFQTTATNNALTTGQQGQWQMTVNRAGFVNLRNAAGTEVGTSGAPLRTDPTGTTTQPVSYATTGSGNATGALRVELPTNGTGVIATVGAVTAITNALPAGSNIIGNVRIDQTTPGTTNAVQANAGTNLNTSALALDASLTAQSLVDNAAFTDGTTRVVPAGHIFDEVAGPALTENDIGASRMDSKRAVVGVIEDATTRGQRVAVSAGGGLSSNLTQVAGAPVATGHGTASGAIRVELPTDGTGLVTTNPGTAANWGVGAIGSAVPANAVYHGAVSSGNLTGIIQADASTIINASTATTTQLVALTSTQKIYITSWDVIAAGTGTIKLVYGTGSSCGTGTTDLTPAYSLTAQAGLSKGSGLGPVLIVPASNALCVTTSAAVGMQGTVSYTKF